MNALQVEIKKICGELEDRLNTYVVESKSDEDMVTLVVDMCNVEMMDLSGIEDEVEASSLLYLRGVDHEFRTVENLYDASLLVTLLLEYKLEWNAGRPVTVTTMYSFLDTCASSYAL